MDRAIRDLAKSIDILAAPGGAPIHSNPPRPNLLAVIQAWRDGPEEIVIAAKGALEAIFLLCRTEEPQHTAMNRIVSQMAGRGMRVLAVASHRHRGGVPEDLSQLPFTLEGLVGFLIPCAPTFLPLWLLHDALE